MNKEVMTVSKLLSSVLDQVSEDNNEYRRDLRILNNLIDEKTTALVGDVVTLSNYTADFSNTISVAKEKLVNPVSRVVESYVIKDLRSVEAVNEQFVDKINDKLENASINSNEDKTRFIESLNTLLNDKYLEIVKIKRTNFVNENGVNEDVEAAIDDFINYLKTAGNYDDNKLLNLFTTYKDEVYGSISKTLSNISVLYMNNFIEGVGSALSGSLDYNEEISQFDQANNDFRPFIPDINPVPPIDVPMTREPDLRMEDDVITEVPEVPEIPPVPKVPNVPDSLEFEPVNPMPVSPVAPIEIAEDSKPEKVEVPKKSYDVEEILKIAKSPVVSIKTPEPDNESNDYVSVSKIREEAEYEPLDGDVNEREIVEEMIKRLTKRLETIDARQAKYDEEKAQLEADEAFVNDLIESSDSKRDELDKFEAELNEKERELADKKKELDKRLNDVLPFANAVLKSENEEPK